MRRDPRDVNMSAGVLSGMVYDCLPQVRLGDVAVGDLLDGSVIFCKYSAVGVYDRLAIGLDPCRMAGTVCSMARSSARYVLCAGPWSGDLKLCVDPAP